MSESYNLTGGNTRILSVYCGKNLEYISKIGQTLKSPVYGVEPSRGYAQTAAGKFHKVLKCSIHDIRISPGSFGLIYADMRGNMLPEYIPRLAEYLAPGGVFIASRLKKGEASDIACPFSYRFCDVSIDNNGDFLTITGKKKSPYCRDKHMEMLIPAYVRGAASLFGNNLACLNRNCKAL